MHLHVLPPGPRSPFRSQRTYNNLLDQILNARAETFVGFCLYVGLLGMKPTDMPTDEPVVHEAAVHASQPGGLLMGAVASDIPAS